MATAGERYFYGTGRRKTAVARVRLYPGTGEILINGKGYMTVFTRGSHQAAVLAPLKAAAADQRFNVQAKVAGGGITGWAGAVSHGIARALVVSDESLKRAAAPPEPADARLPHEGAQEGRPQARPQGAAVHEAVARSVSLRSSVIAVRAPADSAGVSLCRS